MSSLTHPLSWFIQRQGQIINRNGRDFKIKNPEVAKYCHELQESGIKFSDPKQTKAVKITYSSDSVCEACEG